MALAVLGIFAVGACSSIAPDGGLGGDGSQGDGGETSESDTDTGLDTDTDGDTEGETDGETDGDTDGDDLGDDADPHPPTACELDAESTIALHAGDANTRALPPMLRSAVLGSGSLPPVPLAARPFLNYYDFDYPSPDGDALGVHIDAWEIQKGPSGHYRLQIGVTSKAWSAGQRPPIHLTLVADTGSSIGLDGLQTVVASTQLLLGQLSTQDKLTLVALGPDGPELLLDGHALEGPQDPAVLDAIDTLSLVGEEIEDGVEAAMSLGYERAEEHWVPETLNRVLVLSDGRAEFGASHQWAKDHAEGLGMDAIHTMAVGVGASATYQHDVMEALADAGNAPSVYLADDQDVERVLGQQFMRHMAVAALDVRVEVSLPPGLQFATPEFPGSRPEEAETESVHLGPSDHVVFHHLLERCADEDLVDGEIGIRVTWQRPDNLEEMTADAELTMSELAVDSEPAAILRKGAAVVAYARALQLVARDGENATIGLLEALTELDEAQMLDPQDPELAEMAAVLEALAY